MLIVLSPAKSLDFETRPTTKLTTTPDMLERSSALIDVLRDYATDLQSRDGVLKIVAGFVPQRRDDLGDAADLDVLHGVHGRGGDRDVTRDRMRGTAVTPRAARRRRSRRRARPGRR